MTYVDPFEPWGRGVVWTCALGWSEEGGGYGPWKRRGYHHDLTVTSLVEENHPQYRRTVEVGDLV